MKKKGQHLFKWVWMGLLPLLGAVAGLVLMAVGLIRYKNLKLVLTGAVAFVVSLILSVFLFLNMSRSSEEASTTDGDYEAIDSVARDTDIVDELVPVDIPESSSLPVNPFDEVFGSILSVGVDSGSKQFRFQQPVKTGRVVNENRSGFPNQKESQGISTKPASSSKATNQ